MKIDDFKITVTFETSLTASTNSIILTDANIAYSTRDIIIETLRKALHDQEQKNRREKQ